MHLIRNRSRNGLCDMDFRLIFRFFLWIVFLLVLILLFFHLLSMIVIFDLNILYLRLCILVWYLCFVLLFWRFLVVHNGLLDFVWRLLRRLIWCRNRLQIGYYRQPVISFLSFHKTCFNIIYWYSILSCECKLCFYTI